MHLEICNRKLTQRRIDSLELETMRIFMMRKFLGFGAVKICKKLEITTTI